MHAIVVPRDDDGWRGTHRRRLSIAGPSDQPGRWSLGGFLVLILAFLLFAIGQSVYTGRALALSQSHRGLPSARRGAPAVTRVVTPRAAIAAIAAIAAVAILLSSATLAVPAVAGAQWPSLTGPRARAALGDGDPAVRAEAARTLGYYGAVMPSVDALVVALPAERDAVVRRALILALARRGELSCVPVLIEALAAVGSSNRVAAAQALGSFGTEEAVRALAEALGDEEVKVAAARSLVRLGPRAVPHLILATRRRPASTAAVAVLGEVGDHRAVPALIALLGDERATLRVAVLGALRAMGAERAGPSVAELLTDDSSEVRVAAIEALGVVGGPPHVEALEALVESAVPAVPVGPAVSAEASGPVSVARAAAAVRDGVPLRRAALRALVTLAPDRAIAHLERFAGEGEPDLGPLAVDLALGLRTREAAPLLHGLLTEGSRADEAASALAELEAGAGLPVLIHLAADLPPESGVLRAIAVGLRHYRRVVDDEVAAQGYRALGAHRGQRALLLRAIARDDAVHELLVPVLSSADPGDRALAALAAEVHPSPSLVEPLTTALLAEEDSEPFRRMASALAARGAWSGDLGAGGWAPHLARLSRRFDDPDVGPEAMLLAAGAYGAADRWTQRRLGQGFRHALRSSDPRVRTGAAWALARARDAGARRALAVALDDPAREVRHAAARALSSLGAGDLEHAIRRRRRVEEDDEVALALDGAVGSRRPFPAEGLRGDQVLRVRIVPSGGDRRGGIPVDVVLPDGRYLRMNTLGTGELLLVDLPAGAADVRVRVGGAS